MPRFLPQDRQYGESQSITAPQKSSGSPARPGRPDNRGSSSNFRGVNDPDRTYSGILKSRYRDFKKNYAGFEDRILARAQTNTDLIDQAREKGQGSALKALSAGITTRGLERYGANPVHNSLRRQQLDRSSALGGARAGVQALSDARINQYESNQSAIGGLVNIGQKLSQSSLSGLNTASGLHAQRQNAYSGARAGHYANQSNIFGGLGI